MIDRLLRALVQSKNAAADDVLLEALRLGSEDEKQVALDALMRRKTVRGLSGVVAQYETLPEGLRLTVLSKIKQLHPALRECGRSDRLQVRLAALKLIALGRQGKLAYVLTENLHASDETLSKAATEALVALSRWVATETRRLQAGPEGEEEASGFERRVQVSGFRVREEGSGFRVQTSAGSVEPGSGRRGEGISSSLNLEPSHLNPYSELIDQRPEIEATVARALDVHRGRHGQDLLRAALLLCDWPGSKTLAILHTAKHGGQSPLVRRLQQPPASEHVEAFLLGASHGQLRSHFGTAFAHIDEAPVLDALLRKTHWLKDHHLRLCMQGVTRGLWWGDSDLQRDVDRRPPEDAARIGDWLAVSGCHDAMQDERMDRLRAYASESFPARLRLFRAVAGRKRGASVALLRKFLLDPDERLVRLAAREIVRRRPPDFENMLLQLMTGAPESVRRVVSRAIGQSGFENFWQKFDRLSKPTRKQAGRAMLKILPDGVGRLQRRLDSGSVEQRLKAMQMAQELELGEVLKGAIARLCADPNPKLRSKAVALAGMVPGIGGDVLVERLLNDPDARVRANSIEALEGRRDPTIVAALARRARSSNSRERANAIKALHKLRVGTLTGPLLMMLRDNRSEHRISAIWALRQVGWWQLLGEVGRLAKSDADLRVRRYALGVLRGVADLAAQARKAEATAKPASGTALPGAALRSAPA